MSRNRSKDPSVFAEPHLQDGPLEIDPSEDRAAMPRGAQAGDELALQSVWEEPSTAVSLVGTRPAEAPSYQAWLSAGRARTSVSKTWLVTAAIILAAGPFAILGAFLGTRPSMLGLVTLVVVGPLLEEVMKNGAALMVVERRPFLFSSRLQIGVCALAAGVVFAAIENVLYLTVYVPDASESLALWRWTVCVALHSGCALITSLGVMRVWRDVWERRDRPALRLVRPYLIVATVIHGTYNGIAVVLSALDFGF